MKRLFAIWAFLGALLLAVGCSKYDDSGLTDRINDLEQRMKELETLCKETNTNISSLQTLVSAVQNGDYVKEVTPIMQDGKEVGCTISFGKGNPITIYHNSENNTGGSGTMPVIGVRQDEDGTFYWTLNDEWLLDDSGNKITAQSTPPKLKLENGYWYVSYDGEQTWQQLGKATDDDSDLMFQEVTQDDNNVYFTLASGEKIIVPKTSGLSISFQEGNTLLFNNVDEAKTIHYTITGGGKDNVVKAEMLNADGSYTLRTTSTSETAGTIEILAKVPTKNRVIVSVSDGNHTIMAAVDVSLAPSFDGKTVKVETPGTLSGLLAGYDHATITELTVIGSINSTDVATLKALSNLSVLDMENTLLTVLPDYAFKDCENLTSIKLPKTLTTIGNHAFEYCSGLTGSLIIPEEVTTIGNYAFSGCTGFTGSLTLPTNVITIGRDAFSNCSGFTGNLIIPNKVTIIGEQTFYTCEGLTGNLTIPEGVTVIGRLAFGSCKMTQIDCKSNTPPQLGINAFWSTQTKNCVLYVPTGCAEAYRTAEGWKDYTFKEIIETNF